MAAVLQGYVASLVDERGYHDGWTPEQFAARQVAKLQEELAELADAFFLPDDEGAYLQTMMSKTGTIARETFKRGNWHQAQPIRIDEAIDELADLQVVIFVLAEELARLAGRPVNVIRAAMDKSEADVKRGVTKGE